VPHASWLRKGGLDSNSDFRTRDRTSIVDAVVCCAVVASTTLSVVAAIRWHFGNPLVVAEVKPIGRPSWNKPCDFDHASAPP
jgi:hypothetical protein